jgi:hypothetical protein
MITGRKQIAAAQRTMLSNGWVAAPDTRRRNTQPGAPRRQEMGFEVA